jgi:hypothetical protein
MIGNSININITLDISPELERQICHLIEVLTTAQHRYEEDEEDDGE